MVVPLSLSLDPGGLIMESMFFDRMGGAPGIAALVGRFYDIMDTDPRAQGIRAQHAADLTEAREKLRLFLTGWTGGPQLYIEKFGHPRLRARHLPFAIGVSERDQWLLCFRLALDSCDFPDDVKSELFRAIARLADHMRNQPDTANTTGG